MYFATAPISRARLVRGLSGLGFRSGVTYATHSTGQRQSAGARENIYNPYSPAQPGAAPFAYRPRGLGGLGDMVDNGDGTSTDTTTGAITDNVSGAVVSYQAGPAPASAPTDQINITQPTGDSLTAGISMPTITGPSGSSSSGGSSSGGSGGNIFSSLIAAVTGGASAATAVSNAANLATVNAQRAKLGLPPINAAGQPATAGTGTAAGAISPTLMIAGLGLLGLVAVMAMRGKSA